MSAGTDENSGKAVEKPVRLRRTGGLGRIVIFYEIICEVCV